MIKIIICTGDFDNDNFCFFFPADPALRDGVIGITPPDEEKHQFFIDVSPLMGTTLKARARVQINLAVSQVRDIKQVASFPDILFPILWFEDVSIILIKHIKKKKNFPNGILITIVGFHCSLTEIIVVR